MNYLIVLEKWETYNWRYNNDLLGFSTASLCNEFARSQALAHIRRAHPRMKPENVEKNMYKILRREPELLEYIREINTARWGAMLAQRKRQTELLSGLLWEMAEEYYEVPIETGWFEIKTTNTSTYSSQGYGADRYAIAALDPYVVACEALFIEFKIEHDYKEYGRNYTLYARVSRAAIDAVMRRSAPEIADEVFEKRTRERVNERVFNPFSKKEQW